MMIQLSLDWVLYLVSFLCVFHLGGKSVVFATFVFLCLRGKSVVFMHLTFLVPLRPYGKSLDFTLCILSAFVPLWQKPISTPSSSHSKSP
jgi:hypothetical protein